MRFSIITPSLNQGTWLGENLGSSRKAGEEAGVEVEHLVIDGGSTDGTLDILRRQDFARWMSEPDAGQSDAINKGLRQSSGEILCYLCADDFYEAGALGRVKNAFRDSPDIQVVFGDAYFLESDSGWKRRKRAGEFSLRRLRRGNFLLQPAVFWRRSVYEKFGGFDAGLQYCMDHEYWLRIAGGTRWHYLPVPLASCRLHAGAKTSRALGAAWNEAARMQARYGIRFRPFWNALWMNVAGKHLYRLKRSILSTAGKRFAPGTTS